MHAANGFDRSIGEMSKAGMQSCVAGRSELQIVIVCDGTSNSECFWTSQSTAEGKEYVICIRHRFSHVARFDGLASFQIGNMRKTMAEHTKATTYQHEFNSFVDERGIFAKAISHRDMNPPTEFSSWLNIS